MLFRHDQSKAIWLLHNLFLKLLAKQKYKNNLKNHEPQKNKKKKNCDSHMHVYVYVMFYYEK